MTVRIIIVARHAEFRYLLAEFMRHLGRGYDVIGVASRVEEALACIDSLGPDLALVDAELSEGSGLDVAVAVQRRRSATAVIVLGTTDDAEYRRAALAAGAVSYISKAELVATLPTALGATFPLGA